MEQSHNKEQGVEKEKVFRGAITIFFKKIDGEFNFLVVENTETGNASFVSGAEEDVDELSLEKTAQREIKEELGLEADAYQLIPTNVQHEFFFNSKKVERAGKKAEFKIYLADAASIKGEIGHTSELKKAEWMTKEKALSALTFPEFKELFEKATENLKNF